jgi:hypothetical protein
MLAELLGRVDEKPGPDNKREFTHSASLIRFQE